MASIGKLCEAFVLGLVAVSSSHSHPFIFHSAPRLSASEHISLLRAAFFRTGAFKDQKFKDQKYHRDAGNALYAQAFRLARHFAAGSGDPNLEHKKQVGSNVERIGDCVEAMLGEVFSNRRVTTAPSYSWGQL